jgi:hypothetical protein
MPIMLALLGFNAMGDAIRDILDLRLMNETRSMSDLDVF